MKLNKFLNEIYSQNREDDDVESSIRYALRYLTYLDEGNDVLQTDDILYFGEERENVLTGDEILEKGFYTLHTGAHDGIEWLQKFDTYEEALESKRGWDNVKFSPCDFCGILEVE